MVVTLLAGWNMPSRIFSTCESLQPVAQAIHSVLGTCAHGKLSQNISFRSFNCCLPWHCAQARAVHASLVLDRI
eukprot:6475313-Amphidinium_carterae.1